MRALCTEGAMYNAHKSRSMPGDKPCLPDPPEQVASQGKTDDNEPSSISHNSHKSLLCY